MPLDSVCEPVAAFPKELTGDLIVGWPSVIPDATRARHDAKPQPLPDHRRFWEDTPCPSDERHRS